MIGKLGMVLASSAGMALGALLFAPAHWISAAVSQLTQGGVILAQPQGSVWEGSAQLVLHDTASQAPALALPGRLHWRLQGQWLGADITLRTTCCSSTDVVLKWRWSGTAMTLLANTWQMQLPAAVLAGLGAPLNTLQPQGRITMDLNAPALQWRRQAGEWHLVSYAGQLQFGLKHMQSSLSTLPKLGDYLVTLTPDASGKSMALSLHTEDGPLRLEGQGQWDGRRLSFGGFASADAGYEPVLSNVLNLLGQRERQGEGQRTRLKWG
jgi:general secretion pathway protein N